MSYIGKEPQYTDFLSKFFSGDGTAMTVTLDASPPNEAALLVFIDGVRQDTSAYTVSGYSLTFTGAVPSGTNNVQVVHLGIAQDTQVPVDDSVSTVKIQDDAVTSAKLDTNIAIDGDLTVDTDTLHVDSTNNRVGVGTASPSSALHIKDNIPKVIIEDANNGTGGSSYTPYIEFNANGDNVGSVGFTQNGNYLDIKAENYNSAPIRLFTGGSERMRIDSSGKVGIGTSSPTTYSGGGSNFVVRNDQPSGAATCLSLVNDSGNSAGTAVNLDFVPNSNIALAQIQAYRTNANGTTDIKFSTYNGSTLAERMRIDSSGNLQFNSGYGSTATAYGCRAWVNFNGTGTVAIRASGNVSSITDLGTGYYRVNFTTAMPNANYAVGGSAEGVQTYHMMTRSSGGTTTTSVRIRTGEPGGAYADVAIANVIIFR